MKINNALASLAVKDIEAARAWYEKLFGESASTPMSEVCEWKFPNGGGLQVYKGKERAGGCSCTLAVDDVGEVIRELKQLGIDPGNLIDGEAAKVVMIKDPDGNSIAIAQAINPSLVR